MSSFRLSYVVTVFNKRPWLAELAASIIAQDAGPAEIVFVDDCSTDGSQEETERACAVLRAAGHQTRHLRLAENCGPSVATNVGIRHAAGEWIFFVDADDLVAPGAANMMLGAATAWNADLVYAGKAPFTTEPPPPPDGATITVHDDPLWTLVMRKKFGNSFICNRHISGEGCDERIFIQDTSLLLRVARQSRRLIQVTAPVIHYRQTLDSLLSTSPKQDKVDLIGAFAYLLHDGRLPKAVRIRLLQRCLRHCLNIGRRRWRTRLLWWLSLLQITPANADAHVVEEFQKLIAELGLRPGAPRPDPPLRAEAALETHAAR